MNPTRRELLVLAGLAAGAGLAAPMAYAQPNPARTGARRANWAVLGLGNYAELTMRNFAAAKDGRLVSLISGSPDKLEKFGQLYGIDPSLRYGYGDWDRIRNDPRIDIVYVITPVGTHADFAIAALNAGKHVLVEKTLAESAARGRTMIAAAKASQRTLGIAYRAWHDPANQLVMKMARERPLGPVTTVMAHKGMVMQLPAGNWRFDPKLGGGGSLVDIGIYSLQAARYATGEEPVEVQATAFSDPSDPRFQQVEQTIAWSMRFPSGALASCTASWNYTGQNNIRAAYRDGFLSLDPATFGAGNRAFLGQRRNGTFEIEEQALPKVEQLAAQIDHFSRAVISGSPPMTDGVEGLRDLLAIEAIYRSVRSGRREAVART